MECKNCGKEFTEKYSKWSNGNFCSKFCARSFIGKQNKGTKIVKCIDCDNEITVDKRASNKQCKCDNCRKRKNIKHDRYLTNKFCIRCKKPVVKTKFCSGECHRKYEYEQYIEQWKNGEVDGSKAHGYTISNYIRKYLWIKYNNKCSRCGWNTPNPITKKPVLEVEYIDGNSMNNKEENLDLICPNCHSLTTTYKALNKGKGNKLKLKYYGLIK